jgi:hypothetical protein
MGDIYDLVKLANKIYRSAVNGDIAVQISEFSYAEPRRERLDF